jgi:SsrA-binding protein
LPLGTALLFFRIRRGLAPRFAPPRSPHRTEQMAQVKKEDDRQIVARNKRARHDYHILDSWEAGLVLTGTEVKSLRDGKATMADAYAVVKDGEVFLLNLHISPYEKGNQFNHEPTRTRKLLLHRKEIRRLIGSVERQGLTLIPLELYFRGGVAKVTIALGKGKQLHDKRADDRKKTDERDMARVARVR